MFILVLIHLILFFENQLILYIYYLYISKYFIEKNILIYGFYKPAIIEVNFASIYKFINQTAIIFQYYGMSSAIEIF